VQLWRELGARGVLCRCSFRAPRQWSGGCVSLLAPATPHTQGEGLISSALAFPSRHRDYCNVRVQSPLGVCSCWEDGLGSRERGRGPTRACGELTSRGLVVELWNG
jgi:hypothetical protein